MKELTLISLLAICAAGSCYAVCNIGQILLDQQNAEFEAEAKRLRQIAHEEMLEALREQGPS